MPSLEKVDAVLRKYRKEYQELVRKERAKK